MSKIITPLETSCLNTDFKFVGWCDLKALKGLFRDVHITSMHEVYDVNTVLENSEKHQRSIPC